MTQHLAARAAFRNLAPALLAVGLLAGGGARADGVADARAFVVRLYAHYPLDSHKPMFEPLGKDATSVFDASLLHLIREDTRLAGGEVGALDSDPLCECQDDGGMTSQITDVHVDGPMRAKATVVLRFSAASPPEIVEHTLDLVEVAGHWRIHDIHSKDTPSLRDFLAQSNRAQIKANQAHKR
jgi:hypothetical protein